MLNTYCLSKTILFCQNRCCFKTGGTTGSFGICFQQIWFGVYVVYISRYGNYGYDCGNNTLPNSKKENRNKICGEKLKNNIKIKPCGQISTWFLLNTVLCLYSIGATPQYFYTSFRHFMSFFSIIFMRATIIIATAERRTTGAKTPAPSSCVIILLLK